MSILQSGYMIVDSSGNYYRLNRHDQLVAAKGPDEAAVFSFPEANRRIGAGKRAHFYTIIPVEEDPRPGYPADRRYPDPAELKQTSAANSLKDCFCETDSDIAGLGLEEVNWVRYLTSFSFLISQLGVYKGRLSELLSEEDQKICDYLHFVEFYECDETEMPEIIEGLQQARERRRIIKNELFRIDCFKKAIGSPENGVRARDAVRMIRSKEEGSYRPRIERDLFKAGQKKAWKPHDRLAEALENTEDRQEEDIYVMEDEIMTMEMEHERNGTIYDECKPDWKAFVEDQISIFHTIPCRMEDLQFDIRALDIAIEEALQSLEDANYNAVQGYKAFKQLKDLRNERKEKLEEVRVLQEITARMDCGEAVKAFEEIRDECWGGEEEAESVSYDSCGDCGTDPAFESCVREPAGVWAAS